MFRQSFYTGLVVLASGLLVGCNSYVDNGLLGDAMKDDFCPPGCVQDTSASATSLFIKVETNSNLFIKLGGKLDVAGDCRTLYDNSTIVFKLIHSNGTISPLSGVDLRTGQASIACYEGRFTAALDTTAVTSGNYTLQADITSRDSLGAVVTNSTQGVSKVSFQVYP